MKGQEDQHVRSTCSKRTQCTYRKYKQRTNATQIAGLGLHHSKRGEGQGRRAQAGLPRGERRRRAEQELLLEMKNIGGRVRSA